MENKIDYSKLEQELYEVIMIVLKDVKEKKIISSMDVQILLNCLLILKTQIIGFVGV